MSLREMLERVERAVRDSRPAGIAFDLVFVEPEPEAARRDAAEEPRPERQRAPEPEQKEPKVDDITQPVGRAISDDVRQIMATRVGLDPFHVRGSGYAGD
ncbi:MAG TPA: hypothetical protein VML95_12010 [Longimicrobiales bacterium]|nr:hypothetical protein [Longimicrobiales bacterium]